MAKVYSLDLRERVVAFVRSGGSRRAAARHFGVSPSFAVKLLQHCDRTGSPAAFRRGRPKRSLLDAYRKFLIGRVLEKPDITMPELAGELKQRHGLEQRPHCLSRYLCRAGFTYKKNTDGRRERQLEGSASTA